MRKVIWLQMQLGEKAIGAIRLDPKSRDDIPQLLRGFQHLYITPQVHERVFAILEEVLLERNLGRSGDPEPGHQIMWRGYFYLQAMCEGFLMLYDMSDVYIVLSD